MSETKSEGASNADSEAYPVANEKGSWAVDLRPETTFGKSFDVALVDPVIPMVLPRLSGWQAIGNGHVKLSHQFHAGDVEAYLQEHPTPREIALWSLEDGKRTVVWKEDKR